MQIYIVNDPTNNTKDYFCDSQATIAAGQAVGYTGVFVIGTESDANTKLTANQQSWLIASVNDFCVNEKITTPDGILWETVDLNSQPENTDSVYAILNTPNGDWLNATGLDAAKTQFATVQQNYLNFSGLQNVTSLTAWPAKPVPPTTTTTG